MQICKELTPMRYITRVGLCGALGFRPLLTFHVGGRALGSKLGLLQPPVDHEVDDFCRHVGVQVGRDLLRQSK